MDEALLRSQIAEYLADESKLYQDCFKRLGYTEDDPNFKLVSADDPEGQKQWFLSLYVRNKEAIREFLCTREFAKGKTFCQYWRGARKKHIIEVVEVFVYLFIDASQVHVYHSLSFVLTLSSNKLLDGLCDCP